MDNVKVSLKNLYNKYISKKGKYKDKEVLEK